MSRSRQIDWLYKWIGMQIFHDAHLFTTFDCIHWETPR